MPRNVTFDEPRGSSRVSWYPRVTLHQNMSLNNLSRRVSQRMSLHAGRQSRTAHRADRAEKLGHLAKEVKCVRDSSGIARASLQTALNLTSARVSDADCHDLAAFLTAGASEVKRINLGYNSISDAGLALLAPALGGAVALQELWLGGNPLGDAGVAMLAPLLGGMRELAELWLCDVSLHDNGACALAGALAEHGCPRMRWLMLNTNSIADAGAVALAQAPRRHPRRAGMAARRVEAARRPCHVRRRSRDYPHSSSSRCGATTWATRGRRLSPRRCPRARRSSSSSSKATTSPPPASPR